MYLPCTTSVRGSCQDVFGSWCRCVLDLRLCLGVCEREDRPAYLWPAPDVLACNKLLRYEYPALPSGPACPHTTQWSGYPTNTCSYSTMYRTSGNATTRDVDVSVTRDRHSADRKWIVGLSAVVLHGSCDNEDAVSGATWPSILLEPIAKVSGKTSHHDVIATEVRDLGYPDRWVRFCVLAVNWQTLDRDHVILYR